MQTLSRNQNVHSAALLGTILISALLVATASFLAWESGRGRANEVGSSANREIDVQNQPLAIHASIDLQISTNSDDAEESINTGRVVLNSSDLELINDPADYGLQLVGLRFVGVNIPPAATIENAYLTFKADESDSVATSLVIRGHAIDDVQTFTTLTNSISSRATTSAAVQWNDIPAWDVGSTQQSPNLTAIVQELVNRPGWQQNGALSLEIRGSGRRTAVAFDSSVRSAPILHIEWTQPGVNTPTPKPDPKCDIHGDFNCDLHANAHHNDTVTSTVTATTATATSSTAVSTPGVAPECQQTGSVIHEVWTGIPHGELRNLEDDPRFPGDPTEKTQLTQLEAPSNIADNYGARIRAYLCPKKSGQYTFWIAGDNQSQFFLSLTNKPEDKVLYALVPDWTDEREWNKFPEQQQTRLFTLTRRLSLLHRSAPQRRHGW